MASVATKNQFAKLLAQADVKINGDRPWDIVVHSDNFYDRALRSGSVGVGESYMAGEWDCQEVDELIERLIRADLAQYALRNPKAVAYLLGAKVINHGRRSKSFEVAHKHYDIGNDLYKAMLDKRMVYTCGYWKDAKNLDEAQEAKLDLVCRKVGLKPGMRVLDIGGGWGSFAKFAAEKYGVSVVNITVSKEQVALANELCKGLPVENRLQDYRDVNEKFDAIVSIGMFEHVGPKNYREYMKVARRCLVEDGLFLLHTIMGPVSGTAIDPWFNKYIFPNAVVPSLTQISAAAEGSFVIEDVHNFGPYYAKTVMAWHQNFEKAWPKLKDHYGEEFYRMWSLYLKVVAGSFRARTMGLGQVVLSPKGVKGGYTSVR